MNEKIGEIITIVESGTPDRCVGCKVPIHKAVELEELVSDDIITELCD
jgi:hypothetical protein